MKRTLALILALCLVLLTAGCERPSAPEKKPTVPPAQSRSDEYRLVTSGCVLPKMAACVVLVDFADIACSTEEEQWADRFFGHRDSLRAFYLSASKKRLDIVPAADTCGKNDGVVRVTLAENHPSGVHLDDDDFTHSLVNRALRKADPYLDFSAYDRNGDGVLWSTEFTPFIVLAGYEQDFEEYANDPSVGAHMHFTDDDGSSLVLDGVSNDVYIMIGELVYDYVKKENMLNTLEIIAHETGHALGLPDLYDTDDSSLGVGIHSTMGGCIYKDRSGKMNENPVELDSWSKLFLGFLKPQVVTKAGEYILYDDYTGLGNILLIPTQNPDEFFLLENRQLVHYDAVLSDYMGRGGISIWHVNSRHIDPNVYNVDGFVNVSAVNDNEARKGVDLEEANEAVLGYAQLDRHEEEYFNDYDHYFSAAGNDTFGPNTQPSSALTDGRATGITVRVLSDGLASKVKIDFE